MKTELKNELYTLRQLTSRSLKIFLKDKAAVFFSLIAPLIILLLYVLFLGELQLDSLKANFEGTVSDDLLKAFVDSWMLSGVLSVACITVSLSANSIMIQDRQRGALNDMIASPVKNRTVTLAYFLYNLIVTLIICTVLFAVCMLYLVLTGSFYLSAGDFFETFLIMVMSILSSTLLTVFICSFFKTDSAFSAFSGIISAAIGFIIGAYMPTSMYPDAVQSIVCFFPGSYSAGLMRNSLMGGALDEITKLLTPEVASFVRAEMSEAYSLSLDFFGLSVGTTAMYTVLIDSIIVMFVVNIVKSLFPKRNK